MAYEDHTNLLTSSGWSICQYTKIVVHVHTYTALIGEILGRQQEAYANWYLKLKQYFNIYVVCEYFT